LGRLATTLTRCGLVGCLQTANRGADLLAGRRVLDGAGRQHHERRDALANVAVPLSETAASTTPDARMASSISFGAIMYPLLLKRSSSFLSR
jgi:hypothetical protein